MTLSGAVQNPRRFLALTGPTMEEMWLFILIDMKTYPMQPTQAQRFGIPPSQAKPWMHLLSPLVKEALADCGELPARKNRGKQKKHTIKNDLLIDEPCKIHFLSDTVAGKKNDKRLADESGYRLPKGSVLAQDAGLQGFPLEGVSLLQPKNKPRGGELCDADKVRHRLIAGIWVRIEYAIGSVKRYRIVKDKSGNGKPGFRDLGFDICCGLHHFRLNFRPWHDKSITYLNCLLQS